MLLRLDYTPEDFNPSFGSKLMRRSTLRFSLARFMWSAITVGRGSRNKVIQSGMYSAFEIIYRGSLLLANLEISPGMKLAQSSAYKSLDPSEKSAISYFIGLTSAKLLAQKLFCVNWLMHLDVYRQQLNAQTANGGSRPDLVGMDKSNRWLAFEAKGRTHGADKQAKDKAKGQVNQLVRVNGAPLYLGVGLISYFNSGEKLEVYLKDPPLEHGLHLQIDMREFFSDYYRLFIDLIDSDYSRRQVLTASNERRYIVKYIEEIDSRIGIDEEIYKYARDRHSVELLEKTVYSLPEIVNEPDSPTQPLIGEDGVFVELGPRWIARMTGYK
jgi:hypothetical protein